MSKQDENKKQSLIHIADSAGFAIPAFNYSDLWEYLAIVEAADELDACVYTASNMQSVETNRVEYCGAVGKETFSLTSGTVFNHLDHSKSVELCLAAIDSGYQSVMIDASTETLKKNISMVLQVVEYAHANGVLVEAEIGRIMGSNEEGTYTGGAFLADVGECIELVERTGVDSLAVGIGNAHGFYKTEPKIYTQRLKEINDVIEIPLVLHGSTGIPYDVVKECISLGMAKVNVGTLLHRTYLDQLKHELLSNSGNNVIDVMLPVKEAIKDAVKEWIRVCAADGTRKLIMNGVAV